MRYIAPTYNRVSIVLALPRSATYWSTRLVRPGVIDAWHDPLGPLRGDVGALRDRIDAALQADLTGGRLYLADTGGCLFHRALRKALPGARWGFIFRPPQHVARSLARLGLADGVPLLHMQRALREAWCSVDNPITVRYADPFPTGGAQDLFRLATGTKAGAQWIETMRQERLALGREELLDAARA